MTGSPMPAGRHLELAMLAELVRRVEAGHGGVAWIEGEPGIGKSLLLDAFTARCDRSPVTVRTGRGQPGRRPTAPATLARMLGPDLPVTAGLPEAVDRLDAAVAALCADGPVVLVLDDLHEADEASLLAWHRLGRATAHLPLLLVSASRPQPYRQRVAQLRALIEQHEGRAISLGPLSDADLTAVAGDRLGAPPGPRLVRYLRAVGGNPAAALRLIAALDRAGLLHPAAGRTDLGAIGAGSAAVLEEVLCHGLPETTRRALRTAALLGTRFDAAELSCVLDAALPEVMAMLSTAVGRRVVHDDGDGLSFPHRVVRDALARTFTAAQRRSFHYRAASALIAQGAPPATVARHLTGAGRLPAPAIRWLARLTEPALLSDPAAFCALLRRALGQAGGDAGAALAIRAGTVEYRLGHFHRAARCAAAGSDADPRTAAQLRRLAVRAQLRAGQPDRAAELAAGSADAQLGGWHAVALAALDRTAEARHLLAALSDPQTDPMVAAIVTHARVLAGETPPSAEELIRCRDALPAGVEAAELRALIQADLIGLLVQTGPAPLLRAAVAQAATVAADADPQLAERLTAAAGWATYLTGGWADLGVPDPELAALVAARRLRPASTSRSHRRAPAAAPGRAGLELAAIGAERSGRLDVALRLRQRALTPTATDRPSCLHGAEQVARLAVATGARDDAAAVARWCARVAAAERLPAQVAMSALVDGLVAGEPGALLAAADDLGRIGAPLQQAGALEEAAVLLGRAGDRVAAMRALRAAVTAFAAVGATWDVERADARLREVGVRRRTPAAPSTTGWAALTPAEFRVVRLAARGLSNREIAAELFLSQNTVQTHMARIRAKLGLRSRLDIARAAGFRGDSAQPGVVAQPGLVAQRHQPGEGGPRTAVELAEGT
ncbi:LuxR C-terminal-related transcriptional regulator [Plantactinospora sp. KBS50]|uniref:ATP-binding protein n=1 Tax=Plantactinospora sp. KBS50 TaxID=2024580 RepID=UPI001E4A2E57|nr:LuxR C-terminal-related transcriptional regulator [Plantactinospora sp. KBS50]